ncbi:MAG: MFS transporter, partial [Intrasporangium sp.]|uniref:MFS transporter n=1 Tax=Intrasporangium sp. TaxID=1925024 RepID=UPI002647D51A
MTDALPTPRVHAARAAVFAAFAVTGLAFAAFASRVPDIKHTLGLSPGELGVTLLALSAGSVLGLPVSGWFANRFGAARTVVGAGLVQATGLVLAGVAVTAFGSRPVLMAALFVTGLGVGVFDVGMNFEGASVERLLGRSVMPHFHAMFSAGTVVSALIGALLSGLHVPVLAHLAGAALILVGVAPWFLRDFLPAGQPTSPDRECTTPDRECTTPDRECTTPDRECTTPDRE